MTNTGLNNKEESRSAGRINMSNLRMLILRSRRYLSDLLAIAAACVFILIATYRIELPGLYMDEVDFVNAAQGAPDNTMIHMRLGSVPLFIMPYLGALKGLDVRSCLSTLWRIGPDYPPASHCIRSNNPAYLLSAHASKAWCCLGCNYPMDNGT